MTIRNTYIANIEDKGTLFQALEEELCEQKGASAMDFIYGAMGILYWTWILSLRKPNNSHCDNLDIKGKMFVRNMSIGAKLVF